MHYYNYILYNYILYNYILYNYIIIIIINILYNYIIFIIIIFFVKKKNNCLKNFFLPPRSKGRPRGQNGLKTNAPNDRENCQSVSYKILIEGTQGIGIEPFSKKFENFP